MTKLLISVQNAEEASLLQGQHGVGIIDIKDPHNGSLGAATPAVIKNIAEIAPHGMRVSCALGELAELPTELSSGLLNALELCDFAKVGLARMESNNAWPELLADIYGQLPRDVNRVAVCYVDYKQWGAPSPESVIDIAVQLDCSAILFDTYDKETGDLFATWGLTELRRNVELSRDKQLQVAIAGSVALSNLGKVVAVEPDWIAVRGAVCQGARTSSVSITKLSKFISELQKIENCSTSISQSYRIENRF